MTDSSVEKDGRSLYQRLMDAASSGDNVMSVNTLLREAAKALPVSSCAPADDMEDALHQIVQWSEAYPLDIFPEPDLKKAHEVLTAAGMTLDAISAHCMRHVVEGVGKIARSALPESATTTNAAPQDEVASADARNHSGDSATAGAAPIGEVVGQNERGLATVRWSDGGLRPLGTSVYIAPLSASTPPRDGLMDVLDALALRCGWSEVSSRPTVCYLEDAVKAYETSRSSTADIEAATFGQGLLAAAKEVEGHWNDSHTMVNQREQAIRSAEVLRNLPLARSAIAPISK